MHLELLVEEPSAEAALVNLLPAILSGKGTFRIHPHNGKQDLLSRLPHRLRAYRKWLPSDWKIVVLLDADSEACAVLKERLERAAAASGLTTKSQASGGDFQVLNRIVVQELESWLLGDPAAIAAAYPDVPIALFSKSRYRNPDAIRGGTAEALAAILRRYRCFPSGMPKIQVARSISAHRKPDRNRSHSFRVFRTGISEIAAAQEAP